MCATWWHRPGCAPLRRDRAPTDRRQGGIDRVRERGGLSTGEEQSNWPDTRARHDERARIARAAERTLVTADLDLVHEGRDAARVLHADGRADADDDTGRERCFKSNRGY